MPLQPRIAGIILAAVLVLITSESMSAQDAAPTPEQEKTRPGLGASREDLAAAYLRLERAFFVNPPTGETLRNINRNFDRASLAFFTGQFGESIRVLNAAINTLARDAQPDQDRLLAESLKVTFDSPIWSGEAVASPTAWIQTMYTAGSGGESPGPAPHDTRLTLRLRAKETAKTYDFPFTMPARKAQKPEAISIGILIPDQAPATYDVLIVTPDQREIGAGVFYRTRRSLDARRIDNAASLKILEGVAAGLKPALQTCRARNALLADKPSGTNSAQFMTDLRVLADSVEQEIAAIGKGENPYRRRVGDCWRVIPLGPDGSGVEVPARVYAPRAAANNEPMPLVIALHGAGGDENMFLEGYGVGTIRRLADQHGFVLVSPLNGLTSSGGEFFDRILDAIGQDYAIDPKRVYVVGHSMGGAVTTVLAKARCDRIAAACTIAGFGGVKAGTKIPPMLVIAAELDGLMPIARARKAGEAAVEAGLPVEFRVAEGYGHTLAVGAMLPEVIPWLLRHTLPEPSPPIPAKQPSDEKHGK